jgi:hypothetical protein
MERCYMLQQISKKAWDTCPPKILQKQTAVIRLPRFTIQHCIYCRVKPWFPPGDDAHTVMGVIVSFEYAPSCCPRCISLRREDASWRGSTGGVLLCGCLEHRGRLGSSMSHILRCGRTSEDHAFLGPLTPGLHSSDNTKTCTPRVQSRSRCLPMLPTDDGVRSLEKVPGFSGWDDDPSHRRRLRSVVIVPRYRHSFQVYDSAEFHTSS